VCVEVNGSVGDGLFLLAQWGGGGGGGVNSQLFCALFLE